MEKSSKSYTTRLLFDSSIRGGRWIIFDSSIKGGKRSFTPITASVLAWSFFPSQLIHYIWKCGCVVYYQAYSSLLSAYSPCRMISGILSSVHLKGNMALHLKSINQKTTRKVNLGKKKTKQKPLNWNVVLLPLIFMKFAVHLSPEGFFLCKLCSYVF